MSAWTLPIIFTLCISGISLVVAGLSLVLNLRQKSREQRFAFYNAQVLGPALAQIKQFTEVYGEKLLTEASAQDSSQPHRRKTAARSSTKLLTEFSENLYGLSDSLQFLVMVFDERAAREIGLAVDQCDNDVTGWLMKTKSMKDRNSLIGILAEFKKGLIQILYHARTSIPKR